MWYHMPMARQPLILLHLPDGRREVTEPDAIYYLEADGDDTLVRFRGKGRVRDVRRLSEIESTVEPLGFVRVHRSYVVNSTRVREIRPRNEGRGWEVVLQPPVNRVLAVSAERVEQLFGAFN